MFKNLNRIERLCRLKPETLPAFPEALEHRVSTLDSPSLYSIHKNVLQHFEALCKLIINADCKQEVQEGSGPNPQLQSR